MGMSDNHTKSQKRNGGGREWASQVPDLNFEIYDLGPKQPFLLKTAIERAANGQMKGNSGNYTHAARLPRAEGPSSAL